MHKFLSNIFADLICVCFLLLCFPSSAFGQITTVTGTITDPNGIPYAFGTIKAQLTVSGSPVSGQPTVTINNQQQCQSGGFGSAPCQVPFQGTMGPISLDSTGSFTLNLQDNSLVTPALSKWTFTVGISPGVAPPLGTGPQTFSSSITISGTSQSVSSTLSALAPALSHTGSSNPSFSNITSGTNNTATMTVGTGASLGASGTGSVTSTAVTNQAGSPPGSCTAGQIFSDNTNGNFYDCGAGGAPVLVGPQVAGNPNLVDPRNFGVKADGKIVYSGIGVTNGSHTVTCSICNFTSADLGKDIEATEGSCCGASAMFAGTLALPVTQIDVINSTTSVHTVGAAIGTVTSGILGYGTNDDAAWTAVDNFVNASVNCSAVIIPGGYSFVHEPHGNNSGPCNTSSPGHNYNFTWSGYGPYTSVFVLESNFDFAACTTSTTIGTPGCWFNGIQMVLNNFGMTGLGYGNTGTHNVVLISPGLGTQVSDVNLLSFAGADTGTVGFLYQQTRTKFLACDGFGFRCLYAQSAAGTVGSYAFWQFGESKGSNLTVNAGTFYDYGGQYGVVVTATNANVLVSGGIYTGIASSSFNEVTNYGGSQNVGLYAHGGTIYQYGGSWDLSGVATSDGGAADGSSLMFACGVTFRGGASAFAMTTQNTAKFRELCPNTYSSATSFTSLSTTGLTPTAYDAQAAQTGNLSKTLFTVGSVNTQFDVDEALACTTTSAAATVTVNVTYTDISNTSQTVTSGVATCTTLGTASVAGQRVTFMAKAGTTISYATTIANTPTYDVRVTLQQTGLN